jgi:outer membrane murein-binding lipoprotein Lpp
MLEELDSLTEKLNELDARVRLLREENQQLRQQRAATEIELDAMKNRVAVAMRRLDRLIERLPPETRASEAA